MKAKSVNHRLSRRAFFRKTVLLGGTTVLMLGKKAGAGQSLRNLSNSSHVTCGYRLTPHIKKYYETAKK